MELTSEVAPPAEEEVDEEGPSAPARGKRGAGQSGAKAKYAMKFTPIQRKEQLPVRPGPQFLAAIYRNFRNFFAIYSQFIALYRNFFGGPGPQFFPPPACRIQAAGGTAARVGPTLLQTGYH